MDFYSFHVLSYQLFWVSMCCFGSFIVIFTIFKTSEVYVCFRHFAFNMLFKSTIYPWESQTQHTQAFREGAKTSHTAVLPSTPENTSGCFDYSDLFLLNNF